MKRRNFIYNSAAGAIGLMANPINLTANTTSTGKIRLGAPIFEKVSNPEEWIQALKNAGYRAAYSPVNPGTESLVVTDYRKAAAKNDIIIAEVGAWSNPISPDEATAKAALEK